MMKKWEKGILKKRNVANIIRGRFDAIFALENIIVRNHQNE